MYKDWTNCKPIYHFCISIPDIPPADENYTPYFWIGD